MTITCDNIRYCLPNKLYEYIQAGVVPIVNYENIDASKIVAKHYIGVSVKPNDYNVNTLITIINKNLIRYQSNILKSREAMNWEVLEDRLLDIYT